jgi:hypothetical protein
MRNSYNVKTGPTATVWHAAFRLNLYRATTRSLCGKYCIVDYRTPFELISLNDSSLKKGIVYFTNERDSHRKLKKQYNVDVTAQVCERCLAWIVEALQQKRRR